MAHVKLQEINPVADEFHINKYSGRPATMYGDKYALITNRSLKITAVS